MIKEFCKKCYGKLFCVEQEPQMNSNEIISNILKYLTEEDKNNSIKLLYSFFHPFYRTKLGGFAGYKKWINNNFPGLLTSINIGLLESFKEIDECYGYFFISYNFHNKKVILKIYLERAYDYINNLPLYDRYTKSKLYLFWRISKIKLEKAEGMYPWFPDLIEKIKTKGKPFEEKEIIMEASYKHEPKGYGGLPKGEETVTRHVDGDTEFLLREYPDGRIAVDIHSPRNQEGSSTPVTLYYRPTMELKYYSGVKVEPAEFKVLEKEPRYFANGPDDVDIEMSEMRKVPGKDTIFGDVEAAERFATGKIQNRKIIPAKQARREQMEDAPTDFIEETSPYGPVYD